jgi:hypothetical protein
MADELSAEHSSTGLAAGMHRGAAADAWQIGADP